MTDSNIIEFSAVSPSILEKDFRGMIESTSGIPWTVDLSTFQFTYVGPQAESILGYPVDYWYQNDFWGEHIHPDDRDKAILYCAEESKKGRNFNFEYRMIHKDGHAVLILDYVNVVVENDVATRLQGFMFDITSKKQTDDAIKNIAAGVSSNIGKDFYDQLVRHLAILFDADYAFIGLMDNDNSELINSISVWAKDDFGENFSYSLMNTPCAEVIGENTCCHPSGVQALYPLDQLLVDMDIEGYIGTPLFDVHGNPIGIIVVLDTKPMIENTRLNEILEIFSSRASTEIERVKAEDALRQHQSELENIIAQRTEELTFLNKELESFSYSVSHDLRAPLRHIDSFSRILIEEYFEQLDEEAQNYLSRIRNSTSIMGNLIDDLLHLSRVTQRELKRSSIDISQMAHQILENKKAYDADRIVEVDVQANMIAMADYQLVYSVLENLISNAWKYTSKVDIANIKVGVMNSTGTANVSTAVFFVTDNGAGFDMAYKIKLFVAFQRLHSNDEFEGSGIGLATVQRIIHRHGGKIWAESVVNKYATFYFTLDS